MTVACEICDEPVMDQIGYFLHLQTKHDLFPGRKRSFFVVYAEANFGLVQVWNDIILWIMVMPPVVY
ncbi:unnamed protein product [Enterobius vermicularis]|uniref:C2H2-type domain-containing protein n=1 Tax=Enterobius vermicularis TaxID=51028 RepID=A0A0N4V804_ENTVE|nr:unnamed protein product [Enterobius vermicularis]